MNLQKVIEKFERLCASMSKDELYILRGLLIEPVGHEALIAKIDLKIIYLENLPMIAERN